MTGTDNKEGLSSKKQLNSNAWPEKNLGFTIGHD